MPPSDASACWLAPPRGRPAGPDPAGEPPWAPDAPPDPVPVDEWLRRLRPRERLVMELVLHEHTPEQIAEFLGESPAAVHEVVERARERRTAPSGAPGVRPTNRRR
ncbi:sigma factor-like helix-turn-helix DNA-binding protein [Actinomadura macra]|uniref:sigma factor-like helix-turn-helix DNA-binding protein n=1 Tax=Actinomadura macra TaxID=46164 RepID=UPI00082EE55A|nr:sigma factor-like helix-turn-helix DNA-binding protein [Actinomadura macra]